MDSHVCKPQFFVSVAQAVQKCADVLIRLKPLPMAEARFEARLLVNAVLANQDQSGVLQTPEPVLSLAQHNLLDQYLARRLQHEPISRILNQRGFWDYDFCLSSDTLDPRPDSETLIETLLTLGLDLQYPYRLLDLGTGSGCLILTALSLFPRALGVGVDLSAGALQTARLNGDRLGCNTRCLWVKSDWGKALSGHKFDIILANPPYIPSAQIDGLQPEVAVYDPRLALDGGADGLVCYHQLLPQCEDLLTEEGVVLIEIGQGQEQALKPLIDRCGLRLIDQTYDLNAIIRVLVLKKDKKIIGNDDKNGYSHQASRI